MGQPLLPAINPALLAAQLYQESGWNPSAQSHAAAQGIAQFIPGTWATHGIDGNGDGKRDVWDPADAIPSAASYDCELAGYVKKVPGDPTSNMLAAYNAGAYAVIKYGGVPPYKETQNYVKIIRSLEKSFARPVGRVAPSRQAAGAIYFAQKKLGTPYLWGGNGTPEQQGRLDCSGLTQAAYRTVGIELPRVANDQYNAGPHPSRDEAASGGSRLLLRRPHRLAGHPARRAVRQEQYMINAPFTGAVIRFDKIDTPDYFGATRVTKDDKRPCRPTCHRGDVRRVTDLSRRTEGPSRTEGSSRAEGALPRGRSEAGLTGSRPWPELSVKPGP
ncbi:hypothetical protein SMICM17S_13105 [Streptomyces microflavus]